MWEREEEEEQGCGAVKAEELRRLQPSLLQVLPLPSQVTVGGPSWPTFGRLDPYGRGQGGGGWREVGVGGGVGGEKYGHQLHGC